MERDERVSLEAALQVAKKLSAIEKLKLVKHLLVELEPLIERREPKRRGSREDPLQGKTITEEGIEEIKRKLWGTPGAERPTRIVQLGGLWKDVPFDVSTKDIRQVRRELSEGMKRRVERL